MLNVMTSYPPTLAVPPIVARAAPGLPLVEDAGGLAARVLQVGQHGQVTLLEVLQTERQTDRQRRVRSGHLMRRVRHINLTRRVRRTHLMRRVRLPLHQESTRSAGWCVYEANPVQIDRFFSCEVHAPKTNPSTLN